MTKVYHIFQKIARGNPIFFMKIDNIWRYTAHSDLGEAVFCHTSVEAEKKKGLYQNSPFLYGAIS